VQQPKLDITAICEFFWGGEPQRIGVLMTGTRDLWMVAFAALSTLATLAAKKRRRIAGFETE
jgi:hypothetical protein